MTELLQAHAMGQDLARRDGRAKVTGKAPYAYEAVVDNPAYCFPIQAGIARGRVAAMDTGTAESLDGVLAVLTPWNAERIASTVDAEAAVLQHDEVHFHGQLIGAVLAETSEIARQAAELVRVDYERADHDAELRADRDDLYTPDVAGPGAPATTVAGDVDAAMSSAAATVRQTYTTPREHHCAMEPHATVALWDPAASGSDSLTMWESTQGVHTTRAAVTEAFGLEPEQVRVISPYVGGGFGSKGFLKSNTTLAVMAARALPGRAVKLALTRQQVFPLTGYRTPTIQQVRLGADREGRLSAVAMDVIEQTSRIKEFTEPAGTAVRSMYAAPNRRTSHRLAALDVPVPTFMRAPGEAPGSFGPEVAMDELAEQLDMDPIELRVRNEPDVDPESGLPFSSRNLVACLREGARRFGWGERDSTPGVRSRDGWLLGTGVAASSFPAFQFPHSTATIRFADGRYAVDIGAADIGTGAWTVLPQIAADALGVPVEHVDVRIGDTNLPEASIAGGSTGTATWGSAITEAAREFRDKFGADPADGDEATGDIRPNPDAARFSMHSFGAQFAEVAVNAVTGEVRVPRLLGVFAAGRIINERTARSQFVGGMTMGLSMALHENGVLDPRFGKVVNHDLAGYHVASIADASTIRAHWIDEHDPYVNPMGAKGIGEVGIVGTAAAIANAAYHATGIRLRDLPLTPDKLLS